MSGGAFTPRAREFLQDVPNLVLKKPFALADFRATVQQIDPGRADCGGDEVTPSPASPVLYAAESGQGRLQPAPAGGGGPALAGHGRVEGVAGEALVGEIEDLRQGPRCGLDVRSPGALEVLHLHPLSAEGVEGLAFDLRDHEGVLLPEDEEDPVGLRCRLLARDGCPQEAVFGRHAAPRGHGDQPLVAVLGRRGEQRRLEDLGEGLAFQHLAGAALRGEGGGHILVVGRGEDLGAPIADLVPVAGGAVKRDRVRRGRNGLAQRAHDVLVGRRRRRGGHSPDELELRRVVGVESVDPQRRVAPLGAPDGEEAPAGADPRRGGEQYVGTSKTT